MTLPVLIRVLLLSALFLLVISKIHKETTENRRWTIEARNRSNQQRVMEPMIVNVETEYLGWFFFVRFIFIIIIILFYCCYFKFDRPSQPLCSTHLIFRKRSAAISNAFQFRISAQHSNLAPFFFLYYEYSFPKFNLVKIERISLIFLMLGLLDGHS